MHQVSATALIKPCVAPVMTAPPTETPRAATEHSYVPLEMQGRGSPRVHQSLTPRAATEHPSVTWHRSGQGELLHDGFDNKAITLPRQWPLARPHLATRSERCQRAELRMGFAWAIQKDQRDKGLPVLPPCSWCGHPTGYYCDFCDAEAGIANPVCTSCEDTDDFGCGMPPVAACRQCLEKSLTLVQNIVSGPSPQ